MRHDRARLAFILAILAVGLIGNFGCVLGKKISAKIVENSLTEDTVQQLDLKIDVQLKNQTEEWLKIRQLDYTVTSEGKLAGSGTEKVWIIVPVKGRVVVHCPAKVTVSTLNAESIESLQKGAFDYKIKVDVTVVTPEEDIVVSDSKSGKIAVSDPDRFQGIVVVEEAAEPVVLDGGEVDVEITTPEEKTEDDPPVIE